MACYLLIKTKTTEFKLFFINLRSRKNYMLNYRNPYLRIPQLESHRMSHVSIVATRHRITARIETSEHMMRFSKSKYLYSVFCILDSKGGLKVLGW